ncbi:hypothetical protein PWT90_09297 [Aphanocladium album]|nr:hypothetical protein PWT90_09297 [Aphanocladium album]
MGNVPSSDEFESISAHRRSSKSQKAIGWVHIAGEDDYDGVPTTPVIGAPHQLDDAIPTVPSFALLQSQSFAGKRLPKNSFVFGQDPSVATGYHEEGRPSRRSTDASHPLGRVSGSARAASVDEYAELRSGASNRRMDELFLDSTPGLSSSPSTGSSRTISSDSSTSREFPLYIPYRRGSLHQIPGQATRPEKAEAGIDRRASFSRPNPPTAKTYIPYSPPSGEAEDCPAPLFSTPAQEQDFDEQDDPSEVAYRQLGSIKFGSLRITNGSPLSMRRGGENASEATEHDEASMNKPPVSASVAANSHHIFPPSSRRVGDADESSFIDYSAPAASNPYPREPPNSMHVGQAVRGRQRHTSAEDPRSSGGRTDNRMPSDEKRHSRMPSDTQSHGRIPSVIDDEQLKLIRRRRSTRVTSDDASSTYSLPNEDNIPIALWADVSQHKHTNNDSSNEPRLSFQSFRNLIRQNRVKSYLEANSKATTPQKPSHQRSVSEQEPPSNTRARSTSRPRRKLTKRNPNAVAPPVPGSETEQGIATSAPLRPRTPNGQSSRQDVKGHSWSKSDGEVPRMRSSTYSEVLVPPIPQQVEQSLQNHTAGYRTTSGRVPIMLDRSTPAPRAFASFEELLKQVPQPAVRPQQRRRCKTVEFKPLPTPNPELPPKRTPVRVPIPVSTGFENASFNKGLREPRNRQGMYPPPMPTHARSHTVPLVPDQYPPYQDEGCQDGGEDNDALYRYSPENDSTYVSPLSDDDQDLWPITTHEALSQTMQKRSSTFQPREVSPLRHAKSMPIIRRSREMKLRTPAPISAHSRRAQGVAARQHHDQQQQQQPPIPRQSAAPATQTGFSAFCEDNPSYRSATAAVMDEMESSSYLASDRERDRDSNQPPIVYRNGPRRGAEVASNTWRPPYRILHSYYSPAYRNAPIWG